MNSQWILIVPIFVQIHLKTSFIVFAVRIMLFDPPAYFLSHVQWFFNKKLLPHHLRLFIYREVRPPSIPRLRFSFYIEMLLWSTRRSKF